jgi:hypothetical protein
MRTTPLALCLSLGLTAPAFCQSCPSPREEYSAVVEIPVDFTFQDGTYDQQWVFDSLEPVLRETGSDRFILYRFFGSEAKTDFAITRDQTHHEVFCWAKKNIQEQLQTLEYSFASHKGSFTPRPIQWETTMRVADKGRRYWYGKMGTINYVYVGDPDWMILKDARWLADSADHPLLELEIVNPRTKLDPGGEVNLFLSNIDSNMRCFASPQTSEIPVTFLAGSCNKPMRASATDAAKANEGCPIQIATPDPGDTRPIRRHFDFERGACGELDARLDLGPTGALPPGTLVKLRYVFDDGSPAGSTQNSFNPRILYSLKHRELQISGASIYPTRPKPMSLARDN